jgi:predicted lipid-binding transport protein (Tim44 family)
LTTTDIFMIAMFALVAYALWRIFKPDGDSLIPVGRPDAGALRGLFSHHAPKAEIPEANEDLDAKIGRLMKLDKGFEPGQFLAMAEEFFKSVVETVNGKDPAGVKQRSSPSAYRAIRNSAKDGVHIDLLRIRQIAYEGIALEPLSAPKKAVITVRIESEQTALERDRAGRIIRGDENYAEPVTDVWKFSKTLGRTHFEWTLCEIAG